MAVLVSLPQNRKAIRGDGLVNSLNGNSLSGSGTEFQHALYAVVQTFEC